MQMTEDKHQLTLRLPKPLYGSMQRWKTITGQSITSQLIETAMKTERDHQQLLASQRNAHQTVMNVV